MKGRQFKFLIVSTAIVLALIGAVVFTPASLAQQIQQALGFDPDAEASPASQPGAPATSIQPDENGYQGPLPQDSAIAPESATGPDGGAVPAGELSEGSLGSQPDTDGYQGPITLKPASVPDAIDGAGLPPSFDLNAPDGEPDFPQSNGAAPDGWSSFYYRFEAGSSLHSADYTMRQDYQPGACISAVDTGGQFLTLNLDLPDGARIDFLRMYFYDTNAANSTANIRKYDAVGNYSEIVTVSSSGTAGFGYIISDYSGHIVDNSNGAYVLNWLPNVASTTMQLCGLRIAYRLP